MKTSSKLNETRNKLPKPDNLLFYLLLGIALIPPAIALVVLQSSNVDMPMGDQIWMPGKHFEALALGTFKIGDLFVRFNDSRKVLPSALILLSATDGLWSQARERAIAIGAGTVSTLLLAIIYKKSFPKQPILSLGLTFFCAGLYFAPASYYRWIYSPLHRILPEFFLIFSCFLFVQQLPLWQKTTGYLLAAISAELSFAAGLFLWPCNAILLWLEPRCSRRERLFNAIAFGGIAALTIALYFTGDYIEYSSGHEAQSLQQTAIALPALSISVFSRYLEPSANVVLGYLLLFIFLGLTLLCIREKKLTQYIPFLILGFFQLLLSVPMAITRAILIVDPVESSRYYNFSAIYTIGWVSLLVALSFASEIRWRKPAAIALLVCLGILIFHQNQRSLWFPSAMRSERLKAKTCYEFIRLYPGAEECLSSAYQPQSDRPERRLEILSDAGFLPLRSWSEFPPIADPTENKIAQVEGLIDTVKRVDSKIVAYGWAAIRKQPADAIVLVNKNEVGEHEVLGIDNVYDDRRELARQKGRAYLHSGWYTEIEADRITPEGELEIYVYDSDCRKLYLLPNSPTKG